MIYMITCQMNNPFLPLCLLFVCNDGSAERKRKRQHTADPHNFSHEDVIQCLLESRIFEEKTLRGIFPIFFGLHMKIAALRCDVLSFVQAFSVTLSFYSTVFISPKAVCTSIEWYG